MWYFLIPLLIMSIIYFGPKQTIISTLTIIFILVILRVFWAILPIILIIFMYNKFFGKPKPKQNRRTYYYNFKQEDFENFFKTGSNGQQNRNYSSNSSYGVNTNYFEDKSKYYNLLGINADANQDEIKRAFRKKAREYHPDKFSNGTESEKINAEKKFKEINEAYEKLKI